MTAAALARFAAEALAALQDRDHDPLEAEERAAIFGCTVEEAERAQPNKKPQR
jgi:hypothetical protein